MLVGLVHCRLQAIDTDSRCQIHQRAYRACDRDPVMACLISHAQRRSSVYDDAFRSGMPRALDRHLDRLPILVVVDAP
jgi:hypothetical protein